MQRLLALPLSNDINRFDTRNTNWRVLAFFAWLIILVTVAALTLLYTRQNEEIISEVVFTKAALGDTSCSIVAADFLVTDIPSGALPLVKAACVPDKVVCAFVNGDKFNCTAPDTIQFVEQGTPVHMQNPKIHGCSNGCFTMKPSTVPFFSFGTVSKSEVEDYITKFQRNASATMPLAGSYFYVNCDDPGTTCINTSTSQPFGPYYHTLSYYSAGYAYPVSDFIRLANITETGVNVPCAQSRSIGVKTSLFELFSLFLMIVGFIPLMLRVCFRQVDKEKEDEKEKKALEGSSMESIEVVFV